MIDCDYDACFAIFNDYNIIEITWTWYQQYSDDWVCAFECVVFYDSSVKALVQIAEQELYEAIWEISEATWHAGTFCGQSGVFHLDVPARTLCKIAEVGNWECDAYDPDTGPYTPSSHPLPEDEQLCTTL